MRGKVWCLQLPIVSAEKPCKLQQQRSKSASPLISAYCLTRMFWPHRTHSVCRCELLPHMSILHNTTWDLAKIKMPFWMLTRLGAMHKIGVHMGASWRIRLNDRCGYTINVRSDLTTACFSRDHVVRLADDKQSSVTQRLRPPVKCD